MDQNQSSRPGNVGTAVKLLYITLGIGVARSIATVQIASPGFVMFITFFTVSVLGLLIHMIGKGRNWARITLLVLFIIGIPFTIPLLLQSLAINPVSGLLDVGQTVIQIIALVFLFQKPSSTWFKETRAQTG